MSMMQAGCCCGAGGLTHVRAGWYHYSVIEARVAYTYISGGVCCTGGYWTENAPMIAPAGHPLAQPSILADVVDLECGAYHTIARLADNSIVAWGLNHKGQCDVPSGLQYGAGSPHAKKGLIISLHCGYSTSAVMFSDGTVLCWGESAVSSTVNAWTDLMISPIQMIDQDGNTSGGTFDYDNVDPTNTAYAKPLFPPSTWNRNKDVFGQISHSGLGNYPKFDLGCETNQMYPLNMSLSVSCLPAASNTESCNVCSSNTPPYDAIALGVPSAVGNNSSCLTCDSVVVASDFAVGMQRTGQIITSRATNHKTGSATNCRDCSNDNRVRNFQSLFVDYSKDCYQAFTITKPAFPNSTCPTCSVSPARNYTFSGGIASSDWLNFCGAVKWCAGNFAFPCPSAQCWMNSVSIPNCNCCCDAYTLDGTFPAFQNCTDCSSTSAPAVWKRFDYVDANPCESGNNAEGTGCMGAEHDWENYDPNWAKAWGASANSDGSATTVSAGSMFTAGLQVKYSGGAVPAWNVNASCQFAYGWNTLFTPQNNIHICGADTSPSYKCNPQQSITAVCTDRFPSTDGGSTGNASYYCAGKDNSLGSDFWYPKQMFASTLVCGTNSAHWLTQGLQVPEQFFSGANNSDDGCSAVSPQLQLHDCTDAAYQQHENSPIFTSATVWAPAGIFYNATDLNGNYNPFLVSDCPVAGPTQYENKNYVMPTKAWGPISLALYSGFGTSYFSETTVCAHYRTGTLEKYPPFVPRMMGDVNAFIWSFGGVVDGTWGIPPEKNLFCNNDPSGLADHPETIPHCKNYNGTGKVQAVPNFCYTNPPISMATSRAACMIVGAVTRQMTKLVGGLPVATDPSDNQYQIDNCCNGVETDYDGSTVSVAIDSCAVCQMSTDTVEKFGCNRSQSRMLHVWGSLYDPCPPWARIVTSTWTWPSHLTGTTVTATSAQGITTTYPPNC